VSEQRRAQPPQQPPPAQWLQLRYCKRGRARFTSHLDFARAFERALRRAGVPMAYSSGFNPHPRVSYGNAAPTGAATEADYVEIGLAERRDPAEIAAAVSAALPDGLAILAAAEGSGIARRLTASAWRAQVPGLDRTVLGGAVTAFLAASEVVVERQAKSGVRSFDARGPVLALAAPGDGALDLALRHVTPLVRPDDVVQALGRVAPAFRPAGPVLFTRVEQGEWRDGRVLAPLPA